MFTWAPSKVRLISTHGAEKGCIVWFRTPVPENRKSADMAEILAAVATKIVVALVEALLLRLVWQLWSAYAPTLLRAFAPTAA